jgi:hypothetical protein
LRWKHSATRERRAGYTIGGRILAVGGRSPLEELTDDRCTNVCESVLSVAAIEGAIVEAIDMVLLSLPPVDDAMLVVLVWVPGAEPDGYWTFGPAWPAAIEGYSPGDVGPPGGLRFGITLPLIV